MPLRTDDIERLLKSKFGFSPAAGHSSDHKWYELQLPGLPTILTKVSHGKAEVGNVLIGQIARQLRVRGPFFRGMISCNRSREDYEKQVQDDPYPPFNVKL